MKWYEVVAAGVLAVFVLVLVVAGLEPRSAHSKSARMHPAAVAESAPAEAHYPDR